MTLQSADLARIWTPAGDAVVTLTYDDATQLIASVTASVTVGTLTATLTGPNPARSWTRTLSGPGSVTQDLSAFSLGYGGVGVANRPQVNASWGP